MSDQKRVVVCTQRAVSGDESRVAILEEAKPLLAHLMEGIPPDTYSVEIHQLGGSPSAEVIAQLETAFAVGILYECTPGSRQESVISTTSGIIAGKVLKNTKLERVDKKMGHRLLMLFRKKCATA